MQKNQHIIEEYPVDSIVRNLDENDLYRVTSHNKHDAVYLRVARLNGAAHLDQWKVAGSGYDEYDPNHKYWGPVDLISKPE